MYLRSGFLILGVSMKPFYSSKIFWAMLGQCLISVLLLVQEWYSKGDYSVPGCIGLAIGVIVIVLRVWFTDAAISTPQARAKAEAAARDARLNEEELRF